MPCCVRNKIYGLPRCSIRWSPMWCICDMVSLLRNQKQHLLTPKTIWDSVLYVWATCYEDEKIVTQFVGVMEAPTHFWPIYISRFQGWGTRLIYFYACCEIKQLSCHIDSDRRVRVCVYMWLRWWQRTLRDCGAAPQSCRPPPEHASESASVTAKRLINGSADLTLATTESVQREPLQSAGLTSFEMFYRNQSDVETFLWHPVFWGWTKILFCQLVLVLVAGWKSTSLLHTEIASQNQTFQNQTIWSSTGLKKKCIGKVASSDKW